MKKLLFALSLFCTPFLVFAAEERAPVQQFQEQDITPEHFEEILWQPVKRCETEKHLLFFGGLRTADSTHSKIRASLDKATGKIEVDLVSLRLRGLAPAPMPLSPYSERSHATYNALLALYEKQQQVER